MWFKDTGDTVLLLGETGDDLGGSEYLHAVYGQTRGPVPALDLNFEKNLQSAVLEAIKTGTVKSAHDIVDGGLAVALAECCFGNTENMLGAKITYQPQVRPDSLLFGESQSRILLTCAASDAEGLLKHFESKNIPAMTIGTVGGESLEINSLVSLPVGELADAFYNAMPSFMERIR